MLVPFQSARSAPIDEAARRTVELIDKSHLVLRPIEVVAGALWHDRELCAYIQTHDQELFPALCIDRLTRELAQEFLIEVEAINEVYGEQLRELWGKSESYYSGQ
jgi:hypothetical protein